MPALLAPGTQVTAITQPTEVVRCGPDVCDWFRNGSTGMSEGEPYRHPAGVMCGDLTRCRPCVNGSGGPRCGHCDPCRAGTANCPCPERLVSRPGVRGHIQIAERDPLFFVNTGPGLRPVVLDEWFTRTAEGVDAIQQIRTRGL